MTAITAAAPTGTVPRADRPGPARRFARRLPMILLLTVLLIIVVYPLIWLFLSSFKTQSEILNEPFYTLPGSLNLDNYVSAFTTGQMGTYILNSIIAVFP